jgi:hypothetical protein
VVKPNHRARLSTARSIPEMRLTRVALMYINSVRILWRSPRGLIAALKHRRRSRIPEY